jgi:hypothetical protein
MKQEKQSKEKSLPLAIGLNVVLPGLGYMYMGKWIIGIAGCLLIMAISWNAFLSGGDVLTTWLIVNLIMAIDMLILMNKNKAKIIANEMKKCPACAELIKKEAVVCRFCNREV